MSDAKMCAAFMATEEGLAAFLYGLVDQLLGGDTLQPEDGDNPEEEGRIKTLGRGYRNAAMEMLYRLSGLDKLASQRPIRWGAYIHGVAVAEYVAPRGTAHLVRRIEDDPDLGAMVEEMVEEFNRLHPDDAKGPR
jgi:hypothetical protein